MRHAYRLVTVGLMLAFSDYSHGIEIEIVYEDSQGEGFRDPGSLGPLRREAFERAVDIWASKISDTVSLKLSAQFNPEVEDDLLTGGAIAVGAPATFKANLSGLEPLTWYPSGLASQLHGSSLPGDGSSDFPSFHLFVIFNSDVDDVSDEPFFYGLDEPSTDPDVTDFIHVALHEIGHGLGFIRTFNSDSGAWIAGFPDVFSIQLTETGPTLDRDIVDMVNAERKFTLERDFLYWKGPNVIAFGLPGSGAEGGAVNQFGEVKIYAPDIFESPPGLTPEQRGNHFDEDHTAPLLMGIFDRSGLRELDVTREAMIDIGWNFHPRSGSLAWVDFNSTSLGNGTQSQPFSRMADAVEFVSESGTVRILASDSSETLTIDKPMTVESIGGTSSIGIGAP